MIHLDTTVSIGSILIIFCLLMIWIPYRISFVRNVLNFKETWKRHQATKKRLAREFVIRRKYWGT